MMAAIIIITLIFCAMGSNAMKQDAATGCPEAIDRKNECDDFGQTCKGVFWLVFGIAWVLSSLGMLGV